MSTAYPCRVESGPDDGVISAAAVEDGDGDGQDVEEAPEGVQPDGEEEGGAASKLVLVAVDKELVSNKDDKLGEDDSAVESELGKQSACHDV